MIDLDNLRTASLYINNQLLSRGLLRDGQSINFAHPGDNDNSLADTMGCIMGVVNDLILRRDVSLLASLSFLLWTLILIQRDAEHRESLSTTLRALRAESLRQANDIQQLRSKHAEAQRKVSLSEAAETSARAQLKAAEATIHKLKDEAVRMKTLVAQTRSACANEVRKRDRQIDSLKKAISETGRTRGAIKNPGITTINITGEVGGENIEKGTPRGGTENEVYDLRMETNGFLAELAKGLSEENETLLGLVRRTTQSLKEMSGWDKEDGGQADTDGLALALPVNPEEMARDIEAILEHLRTILTNPSFVPIEEVVMREDEINRLRDGWEKMETRWAEAVHLMDGWRKRMQADGRPVNVEELKMGLRLSPVRIKDVAETAHSLGLRLAAVREETEEPSMLQSPSPADSLHLIPAPEYDAELDASDAESSIFEDDVDVNDLDIEEPNVQVLQQSLFDSPPLPAPPQISPLRDHYSAGNRGGSEPQELKSRRRPGDFTTIVEENTYDITEEVKAPRPPPHLIKPQSPKKQAHSLRPMRRAETPPASVDMSDSKSSPDSLMILKPSQEDSTSKAAPTSTRNQRTGAIAAKKPDRFNPTVPSANVTTTRQVASRPTSTRTNNIQQQRSVQPAQQAAEASPTQPPPPTSTKPLRTTSATSTASATSATSVSTATSSSTAKSPTKLGNSRLPLPRTNNLLPAPQQSPLTMATIAAKLAASEREADAARVRAKLKAARLARTGGRNGVVLPPPGTSSGYMEPDGNTDGEPVKRDRDVSLRSAKSVEIELSSSKPEDAQPSGHGLDHSTDSRVGEDKEDMDAVDLVVEKPRKRERRTSKAASRRRSTLNPWELKSLIQGDAGVASAADA